jgi:hypothetical protein
LSLDWFSFYPPRELPRAVGSRQLDPFVGKERLGVGARGAGAEDELGFLCHQAHDSGGIGARGNHNERDEGPPKAARRIGRH